MVVWRIRDGVDSRLEFTGRLVSARLATCSNLPALLATGGNVQYPREMGVTSRARYEKLVRTAISAQTGPRKKRIDSWLWVLQDRFHNGCVGMAYLVRLFPDSGEALGGIFSPSLRGTGIAEEAFRGLIRIAFDRLAFRHITAATRADNIAAVRLWMKLGFHVEGVRREHTSSRQKHPVSLQLGLYRDEYSEHKKR